MNGDPASKVLWKANSSRHDWRDGNPLRRLLRAAERLRLIGAPQWMRRAPDSTSNLAETSGNDLAKLVLATGAAQGRIAELTIGGEDPAPWELFWNVYPFDAAEGWVDGLNTLWLTFDRSRIRDEAQSSALISELFTVHQPRDTEYAVVHPYAHWADFADRYYEVPVTINLQFKGVFWANFLGPGHLEKFDRDKLADLDAHQVRSVDGNGLFLIATPDLASADTPDTERELLRLTQRFRDALLPEWRLSRRR